MVLQFQGVVDGTGYTVALHPVGTATATANSPYSLVQRLPGLFEVIPSESDGEYTTKFFRDGVSIDLLSTYIVGDGIKESTVQLVGEENGGGYTANLYPIGTATATANSPYSLAQTLPGLFEIKPNEPDGEYTVQFSRNGQLLGVLSTYYPKTVNTSTGSGDGGSVDLSEVESRLSAIESAVAATNGSIGTTNSLVSAVSSKVDEVDSKVVAVNSNVSAVGSSVNTVSSGVSATLTQLDAVEVGVGTANSGLTAARSEIGSVSTQVAAVGTNVNSTSASVSGLEGVVNAANNSAALAASKADQALAEAKQARKCAEGNEIIRTSSYRKIDRETGLDLFPAKTVTRNGENIDVTD